MANKVFLCGRLTRDPDVRYGDNQKAVARFSLAVDRRFVRDGDPTADFFNCTAFGKQAEFVEKYLKKGTKMIVIGRLQNNDYTKEDGTKIYSVQILVDELEFAESMRSSEGSSHHDAPQAESSSGGFMNIPAGIDDELPFR